MRIRTILLVLHIFVLGVLQIASGCLEESDNIYNLTCKLSPVLAKMQERWHSIFYAKIHSLTGLSVWPDGKYFV